MPASTHLSETSTTAKPKNYFATTRWSVVLSAGRHDSTGASVALESLCQNYWYPLYAYVRRRGYSAHDAEDLTQAFFAQILAKQSLANADRNKGRFRSFLLGAMNYFLSDEWTKLQAQKRGSGKAALSLDAAAAEQRFDLEPAIGAAPDRTFDKEWATALLDKVLGALEGEYIRDGKGSLFVALKQTLAGSGDAQPYSSLAAELNMNEGAVKTAVHRLRKRYRQLLEAEIGATVGSPEAVKDELAYLLKVIAG